MVAVRARHLTQHRVTLEGQPRRDRLLFRALPQLLVGILVLQAERATTLVAAMAEAVIMAAAAANGIPAVAGAPLSPHRASLPWLVPREAIQVRALLRFRSRVLLVPVTAGYPALRALYS